MLDLALKDLSQVLRDRRSALFLVVMPIIFTAFMGFALGRTGANDDPRLSVGFVAPGAPGSVAESLRGLLEASGALRLVPAEAGDAAAVGERVRSGELAAALIVPADWSARTLAGEQAPLTLIADEATPGGQAARLAVQTAFVRAIGAARAARLAVDATSAARPFADDRERLAALDAAVRQASAAWLKPALGVAVEWAGAGDASQAPPQAFAQSSPGMIVQFAIFGLITSAMLLVLERKTRTLQRLLTTSLGRPAIIAGHTLAMFTVVFAQGLLLVLVGQLFFGVDYLRAPLGTLAVLAALSLWVASLGLCIGALARGEEQVTLFALIAMFLFAGLGGAWFSLESTGPAFAAVGRLLPSAWAMTGFQNIVVRGQGDSSALVPAGVLLAYAAAFFGVAAWRFRAE
ncbi:MAG: ABC transporter permease [Kouleothrix sp.]|nr:ABC transporter permease [Kouleothrix sp.]